MKTAAYTYEDENLLTERNEDDYPYSGEAFKRRKAFVKRNHRKLIKFLSGLDQSQHKQRYWARDDKNSWCGTAACAMGWATLSGKFNGLQYAYERETGDYHAIVNGHLSEFDEAGQAFFGCNTTDRVFMNTKMRLPGVIAALERRLQEIDHEDYV